LTFSRDVGDAFAGVLHIMDRYLGGGFHFGFPQMFFDAALLWQPSRDDASLKRRVDGNGEQYYLVSHGMAGKEP
jgi:hypothetical protein